MKFNNFLYSIFFFTLFFLSSLVFSGPVIEAVRSGDKEEVMKALNAGGSINEVDYIMADEYTPIMAAIDQMDLKMVQFLIEKKADVNFKTTNNKKTALMHIAYLNENYAQTSIPIMKILVEKGADPDAVDINGWTALMYAAYYNTDPVILKALIENKANVNLSTKQGLTPLYIASENNHWQMAELLMKSGANDKILRREDKFQTAAIHKAIDSGYIDVVRVILENKGDVNVQTKGGFGGQTPMHRAVENRNVDIVKLLLKYKPNLSLKDSAGGTALSYAYHGGGEELSEIIGLLRKAGAK